MKKSANGNNIQKSEPSFYIKMSFFLSVIIYKGMLFVLS